MPFFGHRSGKADDEDKVHFPVRGQKPVRLDELGLNVTYEQMVAYPWIVDFDLDDKKQRARAAAIVDLTENWMVTFNVTKMGRTGRKGVGTDVRKTEITQFMDFPTRSEVYHRVYEDWGGGTYNIKVDISPKLVLASYVFDGPALTPGGSSNRATPRPPTLKQTIESDLVLNFMEEMDDDTRNYIGQAVVYRTLGLPIPEREEPLPVDQRLLQQAIESDPDIQQRLIERALKVELGDDDKPQSLNDRLKELRETTDLMGLAPAGGNKQEGWGGVFASVFKGVVDSGQLPAIVQTLTANTTQRQQQSPQSQVIEANHLDVSGQSAQAAQPAAQPPPASARNAQPVQAQQQPGPPVLPPSGTIQGLSADSDWFRIVTEVDVAELDKGIKGDPAQFVGELYARFMDGGEESAGLLVQLFRDNLPDVLVQYLSQDLLPKMRSSEWASLGPQIAGGGDKYQTWVSVAEYLSVQAGLQWLNIAHNTCQWHEQQIKQKLDETPLIQAQGPGQDTTTGGSEPPVAGDSGTVDVAPGPEDYEMENLV